ncbi:MAG: multicopper oxidase family protein [Rhodoglobus sp.]
MEPISRRTALALGGVGALFVVAGGAGLATVLSSTPGVPPLAPDGSELAQPKLLRSVDGLLKVDLVAARSPVVIGGIRVNALTYNGTLPGPTLVVRPGDTLAVTHTNRLNDPTNLHTHGLHVSPEGASDNVLIRIDSGATFDYRYQIPADHPPGVYWYHPHHHGIAAEQVFGGLYGAIIVEETEPIPATVERVLVVSDISFDASGTIATAFAMDQMQGREGSTMLLNGQVGATMSARPGDRERWRIVNACSSRYLDLRLDGQALQLLGIDSGRFAAPRNVESLALMPGNRADVLVTMAEGISVLKTHPVDRGSPAGMMGGNPQSSSVVDLATLTVSGAAVAPFPSAPRSVERDLHSERLDGTRTLTFAVGGAGMGGSMMQFTIDGSSFDPERIDQTVVAGTIEEWTIVNTSPMDHPFHLHVWPMQVVEVGGQALESPAWQDVVNVPARSSSRVRIAFDDFTGTTVYHCHILDHEDLGMMGVISVG